MNTNLLDLNNDILNIIGDFVKKDNKEREIDKLKDTEQIINGKSIYFPKFYDYNISRYILNTKEEIKEYIFNYINYDFPGIKMYALDRKIRLSNDDKIKCFWILFKRCKLIFEDNKVIYNIDDNEEKEVFMEYLTLKNLNFKKKNYPFNY